MRKIILITGGERSGKSRHAEALALSIASCPVYVATARVWDEEFRERIRIHRERRGVQWENIEEEKYLSRLDVTGRVVLVDCLTLWCTNFFFDRVGDAGPVSDNGMEDVTDCALQAAESVKMNSAILQEMEEELTRFTAQDATFIFVTNEIGMGGTPANIVQRRFTDLLGWLNQFVARMADEVVLMVSGIPVKIK